MVTFLWLAIRCLVSLACCWLLLVASCVGCLFGGLGWVLGFGARLCLYAVVYGICVLTNILGWCGLVWVAAVCSSGFS